jgi:hypothetical protein
MQLLTLMMKLDLDHDPRFPNVMVQYPVDSF